MRDTLWDVNKLLHNDAPADSLGIPADDFTKVALAEPFASFPQKRPIAYARKNGEAWVGDSRRLLKKLPDESVDLVFTSPPYALRKPKEYGNETELEYVCWFRPFASEIHRILKPTGSLVLNLGGSWTKGQPTRSLYPYRLILDLCDPSPRRKNAPQFHLAQDFYWLNPAKIPNPVEYVNVRRIRVKDAVEAIWWLSKTPDPKANNREVLVPYSKHMERLIATQRYNDGARPSGWQISKKWGRDNGGAIPPNFLSKDWAENLLNLVVESNTSSNDVLRRQMRQNGKSPHPAMFPLGLPEFFIKFLTAPGDFVVDPFAGSNATGFVADRLDRHWLSIESTQEYVSNSRFRWTDYPREAT